MIELIGDADISTSVTFMTSDSSAICKQNCIQYIIPSSPAFQSTPIIHMCAMKFPSFYAVSEDYVATTELVTFNPGQNNRSVTVQTLTDTLVEGNEMFEASLSLVAGTGQAIVLEDNIATATILDNSGMYNNVEG